MRLASIKDNDIVDGEDICVSVWFQGCPHRCPGCHNPETWSFNGGYEIEEEELYKQVIELIDKNGIMRNLSLLGGEPFCEENVSIAIKLLKIAKEKFPNIKTFAWSGYTMEELKEKYGNNIFKDLDVLIDGRFILEKRDITLYLRGSANQRILKKGIDF